MEVVFGDMNVAMVAGQTKEGKWICRFQRCSKKLTQEMLDSGEYKKYINNSPCILEFKDTKSLNSVLTLLHQLKRMMIEAKIDELEKELKDGPIQ